MHDIPRNALLAVRFLVDKEREFDLFSGGAVLSGGSRTWRVGGVPAVYLRPVPGDPEIMRPVAADGFGLKNVSFENGIWIIYVCRAHNC